MYAKSKTGMYFQREYPELDVELKHMSSMDLTDSEIEFLNMKRMKSRKNYAPDPRLGDYEA